MKLTVIVLLLMLCGLLMAEISPFTLVGEGNYAGKLATYASGDTIVFVTKLPISNTIRYSYSYDGGITWQTMDFFHQEPYLPLSPECEPTLSYTPNESLVSFKNGFVHFVATSINGGPLTLFDPTPLGGGWISITSDKSPFVERVNGQLRGFSLAIPYPEISTNYEQQSVNPFVDPDNPEEYLAPFYYTNIDQSSNEQQVYFYGADVMTGIVRSNSDIYIKQMGGGSNQGWPTFLAPVVTSGVVRSTPPQYPEELVFRGGLYENAPYLGLQHDVPYSITDQIIGPETYNPNKIVMVTVNGDSYTAKLGTITTPRRVFSDVWATYPVGYPNVTPSFRNNFTVSDTMWTILPSGTISGNTVRVNSKLWIKGQFSGHQTWCSPDSIFIIGDITLTNTVPGTDPFPSNTMDSVSLYAGKSILLKYGYSDPVDSLRYHPLCRADNDPIYIYASLFALGDGNGNPRMDGVFTFEYQHPHGSIPATTIIIPSSGYTLFDWIDLHRNRWPQTTNQPWPPLIDYPWYNPLWPENAPYLERGTVHLWGSVVQRRRGFMHRNYYDNEWPSGGIWNIPSDFYGGTSAPNAQTIQLYQNPNVSITLQTRNFPGTTGTGVGYKKNYQWDRRSRLSDGWDEDSPTSVWSIGLNINSWYENDYSWGMVPYYQKSYLRVPHEKCFARRGERAYYSINDQLLYADLDAVSDISATTNGDGVIRSIALSPDASPFVYQLTIADGIDNMTVKAINAVSGAVTYETSLTVATMINDVCVMPNGRRLVATFENPGTINLWEVSPQNNLTHVEVWQIDAMLLPSAARLKTCRLYMLPSGNDRAEVFFHIPADNTSPGSIGSLYHAYTSFPVSNEDYTVPAVPEIKFAAYPNPMRGELKIEVENAKASIVTLDVYNVKGQKVRSIPLPNPNNAAKIEYTWNGTDAKNHKVANGIYMLRLMVNDKAVVTKRICRY